MGENMLAPDFLFCPTDTQLVNYYLRRKVLEKKFCSEAIAEVNIYKYAPWDLPDKSCISNGDLKWYFFCPVEKKYGSGMRLIRATEYGYWKVTGKDKPVYHNEKIVGMMKTLVFYQGKGSEGNQTDWVMHEYRLEDKDLDEKGIVQDAYVLCVVFQNGGPGARCKAPPTPREKDCIHVQAVSTGLNATAPFVPQSQCLGSSAELSYSDTLDMILDDTATSMESPQLSVDDILSMLDIFTEESRIDTPELIDDFSLLVNASELMEAPEYSLDNEGDDILSMSSNFIELDDITPTSIETPQLLDDSILSMLANFTEESTMDSAEIDDLSFLVNVSEFTEAFEVSHDDEAEDTLAMLSTYIEHDDVTPTSTEAPQLSDDSILSMLANFTEESTVDSAEIDDSLLLVNTSGFMEAPEVSPEDEAEDILSMLATFIEHDDVTPTSIEASPPQLSAHNILSMPEIITEDSMIYFEQMEDELSSGC